MKINKAALGLSLGIVWGIAVFLVTNIRLLAGGGGGMLKSLRVLYFGYSYSFFGSLIGLFWGFIDGFIVGWILALLYNYFIKNKK